MEDKVHGGKRRGAGRKPVTNKKKQVTLYVESKSIIPFGNEEKMKGKIYEFISYFGKVPDYTNKVEDLVKNGGFTDRVALSQNTKIEEPYKMFTATVPQFNQYDSYVIEIRECRTLAEVTKTMEFIKNEKLLNPKQLFSLENLAKEVSKDFYMD